MYNSVFFSFSELKLINCVYVCGMLCVVHVHGCVGVHACVCPSHACRGKRRTFRFLPLLLSMISS